MTKPKSARKPAAPEPEPEVKPGLTVVFVPGGVQFPKRHLGLWLGIPGGIMAAVAGFCAVILIAPGVLVGGVDLGWHTPGAASEVVSEVLANTAVTLHTPSQDITLTGEQLGMSVDALSIAELAYGEHPLWKVGAWNPGNLPISVDVDRDAAQAALAAAAPTLFAVPVNAGLTYNSKLAAFTTTESSLGAGVNLDELRSAVSNALSSGSRAVTFDATPAPIEPAVTTTDVQAQASQLNELIDSAGFYVHGAEVSRVDPAVAASWIKITTADDGLKVDVDTDAAMNSTWRIVADLPRLVNRPASDEVIVTNSAGEHLRTVQDGVDGEYLGSTSDIAAEFVKAFAAGNGKYDLAVKDVPYKTTLDYRSIEVNMTTAEAILYENGKVVDVYPIASGKPSTPTPEGHFTVYRQLLSQNMGCVPEYDYCTPNVPWVSYFASDNAFHGTYWHDNFGNGARMSHGCVNMRIPDAERVYYFAQIGTEVWVHF